MLCTTCIEVIWDQYELLNHKDHEREQLNLHNNDNFLVKIKQNFLDEIKNANYWKFKDFTGKADEIDNLVESFFEAEVKKVENRTGQVVELFQNLILKIQRLISMYKWNLRNNSLLQKMIIKNFVLNSKIVKEIFYNFNFKIFESDIFLG